MEAELESLSNFIVERTNSHWADTKRPYYLSNVSPELKKIGIDYKSIIFPDTLKHFAENALSGKVEVVVHPAQKAKVGLIPAGQKYDFLNNEKPPEYFSALVSLHNQGKLNFSPLDPSRGLLVEVNSGIKEAARQPDRDVLLNFLKSLRNCTPDEIDGVKIPTSVLIKFLVRDEN